MSDGKPSERWSRCRCASERSGDRRGNTATVWREEEIIRPRTDAGVGPWSDYFLFTPYCGGVATTITAPLGCTATTTPTFTWLPVAHTQTYWLVVADSNDFSASTTTWFVNLN